MKQFRIIGDECWDYASDKDPVLVTIDYKVQVKILFFWVTIKTFDSADDVYNRILAEELLEKLDERY